MIRRRQDVDLSVTYTWPEVGTSGRRVACPECGKSGLRGGSWAAACVANAGRHLECACGRKYPTDRSKRSHMRTSLDHRGGR